MRTIKLMHAKLHRVKVTEANLEYVGSITVDSELLEQVGILPLEEVEIVNLNNGNRWSTYVLPGEAKSGQICPNGGGALLCQKDDILLIWAYELRERSDVLIEGHQAKVLLVDENNRLKQVFSQTFFPHKDSVDFYCEYSMGKTSGHSDYKMMTKV
jgi:aspartate 1-decarboxylase